MIDRKTVTAGFCAVSQPGSDEILTLGEKIKKRRKELHLTLKDLAGDVVTPAQLSYIETGKCMPSSSLLEYICERIGLDPSYVKESEKHQAEVRCEECLSEYKNCRDTEHDKAAGLLNQMEEVALKYNLDRYLAVVNYERGIRDFDRERMFSPEYNLLSALQIYMRLGDSEGMADCYTKIGAAAISRNMPDDALIYFDKAESLLCKLDPVKPGKVCKLLINRAKACKMKGKTKEAIEDMEGSIRLAVSGTSVETADIYKEAALIACGILDADKCRLYLEKAADAYSSLGMFHRAELVSAIGAYIQGKYGDAEGCAKTANTLVRQGYTHLCSETISFLLRAVYCLLNCGYRGEALEILEKVKDMANLEGQKSFFLYLMSMVYKDRDADLSKKYLIESLYGIDCQDAPLFKTDLLRALGRIYKEEGNYSEAFRYLSEGIRFMKADEEPALWSLKM